MVFYSLVLHICLKNGQKKRRKGKKAEEKTRQCYHNDNCRWKRGRFFGEVEIARGIVWTKILKKRILKKI